MTPRTRSHDPVCFPLWGERMVDVASLAEERWKVIRRGRRWVVRFIPLNHSAQWRDVATFDSIAKAVRFVMIC